MDFVKMHGLGNDYIYVDCLKDRIKVNINQLAVRLSNRHFGIGADGLVLILSSECAHARMRMFNADGSEGLMCGNAIRCVGKYLYDNNIVDDTEIDIETASGIKHLTLFPKNGKVESVEVDMGYASTKPHDIPLVCDEEMIDTPFSIDNQTINGTAISMGNPHLVLCVDDVDSYDLEKFGEQWENHPLFPQRVNTEIVQLVGENHIKMRVWERGSGETFACGTGACASVVAMVLNKELPYYMPIKVSMKGGDLYITVAPDLHVWMKGQATEVFRGTITI